MIKVAVVRALVGRILRVFFRAIRPVRAALRFPRDARYLFRLLNLKSKEELSGNVYVADGLPRAFYINLDHRHDRREQIEHELDKLGGLPAARVPGVLCQPPELGVLEAHLGILEEAEQGEAKPFVVLEDDVQFLCSRFTLEEIVCRVLG